MNSINLRRPRRRRQGNNRRRPQGTSSRNEGISASTAARKRQNPGRGCALAALGGEVGNEKGAAREALAAGRARLIALIERYWSGPGAKNHATTTAALMVGAMINARVADAKSADDILRAARHALYREIAAA
jgi:TetR/AcrR family transcriptional regulator, transcriptional repressor for nem operon